MELERVERQAVDVGGLGGCEVGILARKSQDEVRSHRQTPSCGAPDGVGRRGKVVSSVDAVQTGIGGRLHTIFYQDKRPLLQLGKIVEQLLVHAVRASADHEPDHVRHGERLFIELHELREFAVGVGVGLKVG